MPLYEYRCPTCGPFDSLRRGDYDVCPTCGGQGNRVFSSITFGQVLHSHFNPAFGQEVHSLRHARELAKLASADQSERIGMDVNYELTGAADPDVHKIDKAEAEHYKAKTAEHNQPVSV